MSYYTGFGTETDTAPVPAPAQAPAIAQHTPTNQALSIMFLSGLVWAPALVGGLIGSKLDDEHGKLWGVATGTVFSFMTLRYIAQQMAPGAT